MEVQPGESSFQASLLTRHAVFKQLHIDSRLPNGTIKWKNSVLTEKDIINTLVELIVILQAPPMVSTALELC